MRRVILPQPEMKEARRVATAGPISMTGRRQPQAPYVRSGSTAAVRPGTPG
jgi:hypothetical protein